MIKLRIAEKQDIPGILEVYSEHVLKTAVSFEFELPSPEVFAKRFDEIRRKFPWLICEVNGTVAGFAYAKNYHEDAAYAWSAEITVYIGNNYQRKGIATFLYQCMERLLVLQGYYNLYAGITGSNEKSLKFHKAQGFKEVGTYHNVGFKLGTWHDVVWFEKKLREYKADPWPPTKFSQLDVDEVNTILLDFSEKMSKKINL
ncbi:MAG: N-acetyltransferase [Clostridiales bacterium]|nr:N-acetyltransferase [Clostridiales bacterium]